MLKNYRQHAAERAAQEHPRLPLTAQQTADLVALLKKIRRRAKKPSC